MLIFLNLLSQVIDNLRFYRLGLYVNREIWGLRALIRSNDRICAIESHLYSKVGLIRNEAVN